MRQLNNLGGDALYTDFRVYIEGVQVPFATGQVNSAYGQFPSATVVLAPWRGFSEMTKSYFPKIQIFARDPNQALSTYDRMADAGEGRLENARTQERHSYKLIFDGVISSVVDSKNVGGNSASVTLNCQHPFEVIFEIMLRFALTDQVNSAKTTAMGISDDPSANAQAIMLRSLSGIIDADPGSGLLTIEEGGTNPQVLSASMADCFYRLQGMPGISVALWNQIKQTAFSEAYQKDKSLMTDMYIPLMEQGLAFFQTLTGHPLVEIANQSDAGVDDGSLTDRAEVLMQGAKGTDTTVNTSGQTLAVPPGAGVFGAIRKALVQIFSHSWIQQGNGEITSYGELFHKLIALLEYDHVVLASPAMVGIFGVNERIEHVMKPRFTNYYAPICNVLLPHMYTSMSVNVNSAAAPSRSVLQGESFMLDEVINQQGQASALNYIAPHSVRKEIGGEGGRLVDTLQSQRLAVGRYEWGSGLRISTGQMPYWYAILSQSDFAMKEADSARVIALKNAWNNLFNDPPFNPWEDESVNGASAFNRIFFTRADQEFIELQAATRTGMVQGIFNPYIVVGYPADIVDPSPLRTSYHGLVSSVSHSFSSEGYAETNIGLSNCVTFDELSTCYIPPTYPWLLEPLGLLDNPSIWNNQTGWEKANQFYAEVFGVGASNPSMLVSSFTGLPMPVSRSGGIWQLGGIEKPKDQIQTLYTSTLGNLNLVARNIASLLDIEAKYCKNAETFIDIDMWNEGNVTLEYVRKGPWVQDVEKPADLKRGRDFESSAFLDYGEDYEMVVVPPETQPENFRSEQLNKGKAKVDAVYIKARADLDPKDLPPLGARCKIGGLDGDSMAKLKTCHPDLIRVVKEVVKDIPIVVTSGHRPASHNAKVGGATGSRHLKNPSWAIDMVPCGLTGSAFDDHNRTQMKVFSEHVLRVASALGVTLRWGGTFSGYYDPVHFDLGLG